MLPPIAPFFGPKQILREKQKAERRAAAAARPDAARHAARLFIAHVPLPERATVALYHPLRDELDTGPLADALIERGAALALPAIVRRKSPLVFRRFTAGAALEKGAHGCMEPGEGCETVAPDVVVVPLLAFTREGDRLGYGGGYYDRTLAALRTDRTILAVGYAYGAQEVDGLPSSPLDQRLDWIVTEREAIRAR